MTLYEKIKILYPQLEDKDFMEETIRLQNDSDGRGDYIAQWNHPTLPEPTQEQLDAIVDAQAATLATQAAEIAALKAKG